MYAFDQQRMSLKQITTCYNVVYDTYHELLHRNVLGARQLPDHKARHGVGGIPLVVVCLDDGPHVEARGVLALVLVRVVGVDGVGDIGTDQETLLHDDALPKREQREQRGRKVKYPTVSNRTKVLGLGVTVKYSQPYEGVKSRRCGEVQPTV